MVYLLLVLVIIDFGARMVAAVSGSFLDVLK
jgi:hypothetical protein